MAIQATGILLDGCVLSLLSEEDAYGYSLTQRVKDVLGVSESTLYPVMRRLQTDDCLTVYDMPHNGRNRRYYRITDRGLERLRLCSEEWTDFKRRVNMILHPPAAPCAARGSGVERDSLPRNEGDWGRSPHSNGGASQ